MKSSFHPKRSGKLYNTLHDTAQTAVGESDAIQLGQAAAYGSANSGISASFVIIMVSSALLLASGGAYTYVQYGPSRTGPSLLGISAPSSPSPPGTVVVGDPPATSPSPAPPPTPPPVIPVSNFKHKKGVLGAVGMTNVHLDSLDNTSTMLYNYNLKPSSNYEINFINRNDMEFIPMFGGAFVQLEHSNSQLENWPLMQNGANRRCFLWTSAIPTDINSQYYGSQLCTSQDIVDVITASRSLFNKPITRVALFNEPWPTAAFEEPASEAVPWFKDVLQPALASLGITSVISWTTQADGTGTKALAYDAEFFRGCKDYGCNLDLFTGWSIHNYNTKYDYWVTRYTAYTGTFYTQREAEFSAGYGGWTAQQWSTFFRTPKLLITEHNAEQETGTSFGPPDNTGTCQRWTGEFGGPDTCEGNACQWGLGSLNWLFDVAQTNVEVVVPWPTWYDLSKDNIAGSSSGRLVYPDGGLTPTGRAFIALPEHPELVMCEESARAPSPPPQPPGTPPPPTELSCDAFKTRLNTFDVLSGRPCYEVRTIVEGGCEKYLSYNPENRNLRLCFTDAPIGPNTYCNQTKEVAKCDTPPPLPPSPPPSPSSPSPPPRWPPPPALAMLPPAPPLGCPDMQGRENTLALFGIDQFCYNVMTTDPQGCAHYYSQPYTNNRMRLCYNPIEPNTDPTVTCQQRDFLICPFTPPSPPPAPGSVSPSPPPAAVDSPPPPVGGGDPSPPPVAGDPSPPPVAGDPSPPPAADSPPPPAPHTCGLREGRINTQNLGNGKFCGDLATTTVHTCDGLYSQTLNNGKTRICYNPIAPATDGATMCAEGDLLVCGLNPPSPPPVGGGDPSPPPTPPAVVESPPPSPPPTPPAPHTCALREGRINTQNLGNGKFCGDLATTTVHTCDGLYSQTLNNGNTRICYNPIAPATDGATMCAQGDLLVCGLNPPSPPPAR
jgi:hypothetical protein